MSYLARRRQPASLALPEDDDLDLPDHPPADDDVVTSTLIDGLCERLSPEQTTILRLHVVADKSLPYVARELGIARRTAYRRWHNIIEIGRRYWEEVG